MKDGKQNDRQGVAPEFVRNGDLEAALWRWENGHTFDANGDESNYRLELYRWRTAAPSDDRQGVALSDEEIAAVWLDCGGGLSGNNYHIFAHALLSRAPSSRAEVARLLEWIEEAVEYVGCTTWSPSLESEGRKLLAAAEAPNGDQ